MSKKLYLDFRFFGSAKEVHAFLKREMHLPEYYGMNLDALYDVLTDPMEKTEVVYRTSGQVFERGFINVLLDAAAENPDLLVTEEGVPAEVGEA